MKKVIEAFIAAFYAKIEAIESSDSPDNLVAYMTEVELLELQIELLERVLTEGQES